jgi:hypothetical protein
MDKIFLFVKIPKSSQNAGKKLFDPQKKKKLQSNRFSGSPDSIFACAHKRTL